MQFQARDGSIFHGMRCPCGARGEGGGRVAATKGLAGGPGARAFTLVELLTVVAIIAVLAGLLLAVSGNMLASSRRAKCAGNLRQLGAATQLYAGENNMAIYAPASLTTVKFVGKATGSGDENRFLNAYLGGTTNSTNMPVARCPADKGMGATRLLYDSVGTSYMINYRAPNNVLTLWAPSQPTFSLLKVRQPSKTLMILDQCAYNWNSSEGYVSRNQKWHSGTNPLRVNACFVDGHVEYITIPAPNSTAKYPDPDGGEFTWFP